MKPRWPLPKGVMAGVTTCLGGVSAQPWSGLNLGAHVGDCEASVIENRRRLDQATGCPHPVAWVDQVHSNKLYELKKPLGESAQVAHPLAPVATADALYTRQLKQPIAVLTADCLPLLMTNREGSEIAAVHGGWRGLLSGVIETTVNHFSAPGTELSVWLGPAICSSCYEVGREVIEPFLEKDRCFSQAVRASKKGHNKWYLDMVKVAQLILNHQGVTQLYGAHCCTYEDQRFYSYRRSAQTGRIASLIWIA